MSDSESKSREIFIDSDPKSSYSEEERDEPPQTRLNLTINSKTLTRKRCHDAFEADALIL